MLPDKPAEKSVPQATNTNFLPSILLLEMAVGFAKGFTCRAPSPSWPLLPSPKAIRIPFAGDFFPKS